MYRGALCMGASVAQSPVQNWPTTAHIAVSSVELIWKTTLLSERTANCNIDLRQYVALEVPQCGRTRWGQCSKVYCCWIAYSLEITLYRAAQEVWRLREGSRTLGNVLCICRRMLMRQAAQCGSSTWVSLRTVCWRWRRNKYDIFWVCVCSLRYPFVGSGEAISITYSECVFVVLGMRLLAVEKQ